MVHSFFLFSVICFGILVKSNNYVCDGDKYYAFLSNKNTAYAMDRSDGSLIYEQPLSNRYSGFQGAAIDPIEKMAYMIATKTNSSTKSKERYLIRIDLQKTFAEPNGTDIAPKADDIFMKEIKRLGQGWAGIAFDCNGNLFGLTTNNHKYSNNSVYQINKNDGEIKLVGSKHETPGNNNGHSIAFNWDNNYLYRFAGHQPHAFTAINKETGKILIEYNLTTNGRNPYSLKYLGNKQFMALVNGNTNNKHYQYIITLMDNHSNKIKSVDVKNINFKSLKAVFLTTASDEICVPCNPMDRIESKAVRFVINCNKSILFFIFCAALYLYV